LIPGKLGEKVCDCRLVVESTRLCVFMIIAPNASLSKTRGPVYGSSLVSSQVIRGGSLSVCGTSGSLNSSSPLLLPFLLGIRTLLGSRAEDSQPHQSSAQNVSEIRSSSFSRKCAPFVDFYSYIELLPPNMLGAARTQMKPIESVSQ
jgi:hypothetical protein